MLRLFAVVLPPCPFHLFPASRWRVRSSQLFYVHCILRVFSYCMANINALFPENGGNTGACVVATNAVLAHGSDPSRQAVTSVHVISCLPVAPMQIIDTLPEPCLGRLHAAAGKKREFHRLLYSVVMWRLRSRCESASGGADDRAYIPTLIRELQETLSSNNGNWRREFKSLRVVTWGFLFVNKRRF
jgi:hypothetical protein